MAGSDFMQRAAQEIFESALAAVDAREATNRAVRVEGSTLTIAESKFPLPSIFECDVISIGKAAWPMAEGMKLGLQSQLAAGRVVANGVITAPQVAIENRTLSTGWQHFVGGHPLPNEESLSAAQAAFALLERVNATGGLLVFLISGGGSAMIEWPSDETIPLPDLRVAHQALITCGAPIREINAVRRSFSAVKGGQLAARAPLAKKITLLVCDTNPGDERDVSSGPSLTPLSDAPDPQEVIGRYGLESRLPISILEAIRAGGERPQSGENTEHPFYVLLDNQTAVQAAARKAEQVGFKVEVVTDVCEQPIAEGCEQLMARLNSLRESSRGGDGPVCLISGGEFSCPVMGNGVGGRNSETVLRCAIELHKRRLEAIDNEKAEHVVVFSAGTDGIDGNSPAAGAVADDTTIARGHSLGLDADAYLQRSDSFSYFQALGDAIIMGPTGTNVRDLRIILAGN
ncbi:MAG TPA: DUF4147 domain-containing protein [Pyrinomonadaceae bacterium]|jgi:hydroxypyruvate reductase